MKETIKNRHGKKIICLIEKSNNQKNLVFIMHGLSGYKEQPHIQKIAEAFKENNYTVIRFDTTNSFGESDGKYEDATVTNYYEDLEDVINWAKNQPWYQEPFVLAGHSLGSMCILLYAEKFPEKIKALAPISSAINDNLKEKIRTDKNLKEWREKGIKESISYSGKVKRLKWAYMIDAANYDPLEKANLLVMPILLIVGEKDTSTPLEYQLRIKNKVKGKTELHIIKNAEHTFREKKELEELKSIFNNWIKSLNP